MVWISNRKKPDSQMVLKNNKGDSLGWYSYGNQKIS